MEAANPILPFFILGVCLIIVLVCREVTCWYFKINELNRKLDTTNKTLADIRDLLAHTAAASIAPPAAAKPRPEAVPGSGPARVVNGLRGIADAVDKSRP